MISSLKIINGPKEKEAPEEKETTATEKEYKTANSFLESIQNFKDYPTLERGLFGIKIKIF